MAEQIFEALGFPRELGLGTAELLLLVASIGSSLSVYVSSDTHGWVTFGARTPFPKLPLQAKLKVYSAMFCTAAFVCVVFMRLSHLD